MTFLYPLLTPWSKLTIFCRCDCCSGSTASMAPKYPFKEEISRLIAFKAVRAAFFRLPSSAIRLANRA